MTDSDTTLDTEGRAVAIVSGKGGSGKTLIATDMAVQFAHARVLRGWNPRFEYSVALMDADTGTGGMSYYLGLRQVRNIRVGVTSVVKKELLADTFAMSAAVKGVLQPLDAGALRFLPIGDMRRLRHQYFDEWVENEDAAPFSGPALPLDIVVTALKSLAQHVIVDCRGGLDAETLRVCSAVDEIIMVVEPDTTSFQASRSLADALSDAGLIDRLQGFVINKVFSDPTPAIQNGTSVFGTRFLAAVPFDFRAAQAFLVGELPDSRSLFATHVQAALSRAYPDLMDPPARRVWTSKDYSRISVFTQEQSRISVVGGFLIVIACIALGLNYAVAREPTVAFYVTLGILALVGALLPWLAGGLPVLGGMFRRLFGIRSRERM